MALVLESSESLSWIETSSELISFVLVEASTYGPPYKKDQKIVSGINSFIASHGRDIPVNLFEGSDHLVHATVRSGFSIFKCRNITSGYDEKSYFCMKKKLKLRFHFKYFDLCNNFFVLSLT